MKKVLSLLFLCIFLFIASFVIVSKSSSDELDDITKQINDLTSALNMSINATKPLQSQLDSLKLQIANIKNRVAAIEQDVATKKKNIDQGYADLAKEEIVLNRTIRDYYIKSYYNSPLLMFLSAASASELTQILAYQKAATDQDKIIITNIALTVQDLEEKKKILENEQVRLTAAKANLDEQSAKLDKIVTGAKAYQSDLSGQIAQLTAKQQEIINARSGGFTVNIGDSELADDYNASIKGFRESAPSGYFGVFSFGAYTHRNGMSQYGALGRASTQSTEQILSFYYPGKELKKDYSEPSTIRVKGPGTSCYIQADGTYNKYYDEDVEFKTYLKRIYEVPGTWPENVLKAQVVTARSYAINRMNNAGFVAPNQGAGGQVSKDCEKGGAWNSAVDSIPGWVLTEGGSAAFTEYSSTTGGWINGVGWDTTDGGGGRNFLNKSYEKIAGSPWVYKAWYTETYRNNSDKCGRANPWLSPEEMADIVNAAIALKTGGIDTSRITPITTSCWSGNPYSIDELKNLVAGNGGISSANSVSVSQGEGNTNSVTINGITFSGAEFKKAFNLRAPGQLSIPQSGFAFYNIEKK